jgi:hypothetical protein
MANDKTKKKAGHFYFRGLSLVVAENNDFSGIPTYW